MKYRTYNTKTIMYGDTEVTYVCFYLSLAHELLSRAHDIISQSENTKYIHECCLKFGGE